MKNKWVRLGVILVAMLAAWLKLDGGGDARPTSVAPPAATSAPTAVPSSGRETPAPARNAAPSALSQAMSGMRQTGPYTVDGVTIVDIHTGKTLPIEAVDLKPTLDRIAAGEKNRHANDGSVWENRARSLPKQPRGYYHEYVVPTPGVSGPGPQRLVIGKGGEIYYTPDHYETFLRLEKRE